MTSTWRTAQSDIVYVCCQGVGYWPPYHNTIYKSADRGKTWKSIWSSDPRFIKPEVATGFELNVEPGWVKYDLQWGNDIASGLTVSDGDSNYLLRTENGTTHVSHDGGATWQSSYTRLAPGAKPGKKTRWVSTGMQVTTTWHYYWDPFDNDRQYICYTDIGFAVSADGGNSWTYSPTGSPWANTFYDIALDPAKKGVIYAACSAVHDIPHSTYTDIRGSSGAGGACMSTDGGASWKPIWEGVAPQPITSICLDPKSPPDSRTLYVSSWREGIFKSTDGGKTWTKKVNGFGTEKNKRALMVRMAPSGALYASTGPIREGSQFPYPGGLYKSTDGADSWTCINAQLKLGWETGFAVDPADENVIYCAASSGWSNHQGGLYKTTDGGKNWRQVFSDSTPFGRAADSVQAMFVVAPPRRPEGPVPRHGRQRPVDLPRRRRDLEGVRGHPVRHDPPRGVRSQGPRHDSRDVLRRRRLAGSGVRQGDHGRQVAVSSRAIPARPRRALNARRALVYNIPGTPPLPKGCRLGVTIASIIDLTKRFGDFVAVDHVTFDIEEGEIFTLLGPNGAGKTTTIRMLMGILRPSEGGATIKGLDCFADRAEVKRYVGYLPDDPVFYDYLTGREILRFVSEMHGIARRKAAERVGELAERLDLRDALDDFASNYSSGMKKKLALIACLMHDPEFLILDEPTNGLDPFATRTVHGMLREMTAAGKSIFFSTHLLDQAEKLSTRVGILYKARLAAVGRLDELRSGLAADSTLEEIFFAVARGEGAAAGEASP